MSGVLRWEPPPPSPFGGWKTAREPKPSPWAEAADELRQHPGRWGVIYEGVQGFASTIATLVNTAQHRGRPFAPAGSFEAVSRKRKTDGVCCTHARYVGEG